MIIFKCDYFPNSGNFQSEVAILPGLHAGTLTEVHMIKNCFIGLFLLLAVSGWVAALNAVALFSVHSANDALSAIEMLKPVPENDSMRSALAVIVKVQQCDINSQPEALLFFIDEWRTTAQQRIKTFFEKEPELYQQLQKDYNCNRSAS